MSMRKIKISPRQTIIFQLLIDGKSSKDIALALDVKPRTIRRQMQRVKQKTKALSLYQCIAILVAEKIVSPTPLPALDIP